MNRANTVHDDFFNVKMVDNNKTHADFYKTPMHRNKEHCRFYNACDDDGCTCSHLK